MTMEMRAVGKVGKVTIIDGAFVFWMMDTYGLGVREYSDMLRSEGMAFSVDGFIQAACKAGRKPTWIMNSLQEARPAELPADTLTQFVELIISRELGKAS